MSREKSISIYTSNENASAKAPDWTYRWPNDPDRTFDYTRLLSQSNDGGFAQAANPSARIAIVGAGAAGLTAARELFRCGFARIDVYESSDRIGGRLWSIPAAGQHACFELGAMRMPFFCEPGSGNSLLDYYCQLFGLKTQAFPNPGSSVADTGIYINNGFGPEADRARPPRMDIWAAAEEQPPHPLLERVHAKWSSFADRMQRHCRSAYEEGGATWSLLWKAIATRYNGMSFSDLIFEPALRSDTEVVGGDFGGLGMSKHEAEIFYVIGAGDGGWGAFFHVAALYPIRVLLFGYATNHQLIKGRFDDQGFSPGARHRATLHDSRGNSLASPGWLGVQSVAEGLLYHPIDETTGSLYDAIDGSDDEVNLYCRTRVEGVKKLDHGVELSSDLGKRQYDAAILTCPTWALQLGMRIEGFEPEEYPYATKNSLAQSHWITSCKVFFPLRERYWTNSPIPQLMMTDSFIQGVYGYAAESANGDEPGILLASYTWEDDATKLLSFSDDTELAARCLAEIDDICLRASNIKTRMSPFVDTESPVVVHWSRQPSYAGCSKLYRARTWDENHALAAYSQDYSHRSNLYFAGDGFGFTSGWVESAMRSAVDASIHLAKNLGATFRGFDPDKDYPAINSDWTPEEPAEVESGLARFYAAEESVEYVETSDGVGLAWAVAGKGIPLVKAGNWLTHLRYDWTSPVWRHWVEFLAQNYRLLRHDERGCGLSKGEVQNLTFARWLADLEDVVQAAAFDGSVGILGISQGAATAIAYSVRHPEKVSHLILYGGYATGWARRGDSSGESRYRAIVELARQGWGSDNASFRRIFTSRFLPDGSERQLAWFDELCAATTTPDMAGRLLDARAEVNVSDLLGQVSVPTLVIHGKRDQVVPFAEGEQLAAEIPGAELVSLDSANHILMEGEPAWHELKTHVLAFSHRYGRAPRS